MDRRVHRWRVLSQPRRGQGTRGCGSVVGGGSSEVRYIYVSGYSELADLDAFTRNLSERCPGAQTNNRAELLVSLVSRTF
jgi:hypothetical protein